MKKFIKKPRWGLPDGQPSKEYPPLDKELLDYAIDQLGNVPFANKASVEERIGFIVGLHRVLKLEQEQPPRLKDVIFNLKCVGKTAKELRSHLSELDYLSLRELRQHGAFEHPSLLVPIDETRRRGNELMALGESKGSRLLSMLDMIVEASERALTELPEKDPGGSKKHPMLEASADDELVGWCYKLFDEYWPGEASTTEGGKFRTFVSTVYELSTGCEKDLERSVKKRRPK